MLEAQKLSEIPEHIKSSGRLLVDWEIREYVKQYRMLEPFEEHLKRNGVISYGLSSMGYDIRVADEFKVFTNLKQAVVDPKQFSPDSFIDFKGPVCTVPPNSFALARTVEYFRIPRGLMTLCVGKCLTGDTKVIDGVTGEWVALRDFVAEQRPRIAAWGDGQCESRLVLGHYVRDPEPVFEVRTFSGRKIKATWSHPMLTVHGWQTIGELKVGDAVAVSRCAPLFGTAEPSEASLDLLGLMISNGQCGKEGGSPTYTTGDKVLMEIAQQAAERLGAHTSRIDRYSVRFVNRRGRGGLMTGHPSVMNAWFASLGLNVRSPYKAVPRTVFQAVKPAVARFMRALYSGDGSAYRRGDSVYVEYYTTSEILARQVQHLLGRFGIAALLRTKQPVGGRLAYILRITDKDNIQLFAREIGFIPGSVKDQRLMEILEWIRANPKQKSNFDTLPQDAWRYVWNAVERRRASFSKLTGAHSATRQSLRRSWAASVAALTDDSHLSTLANQAIMWDRITAITPCGTETVYDVTVDGAHNFLANDFIVHNSTYARCGIIVNVTPFEPGWEGHATLEISNTTPLPARIYSFEGIAQVLFFEAGSLPEVSYADRKGKYQGQQGITLPKV